MTMIYPSSDDTQGSISVTEENLETLKNLYRDAVDEDQLSFQYGDIELEINYATYLISHMENILNLNKKETYA